MKEGESKFNYLIFGFSAVGIASCVFLSLLFINEESTIMLIVFNLLFASLTFPLNGTLIRKASLLLMGNIIGLFWNYLFSLFAYTVAHHLGESFNVLYMILSTFVNLVWIVSFWSISLTALASSENRKVRLRLDN